MRAFLLRSSWLAAAIALLLGASTARAQAHTVDRVDVETTPEAVAVSIHGRGLRAPRVDLAEREIKLFLERTALPRWLDTTGDGRVLVGVRARPGQQGAAVLSLRLHPGSEPIDATLIQVESTPERIQVLLDPRLVPAPAPAPAGAATSAPSVAAPTPSPAPSASSAREAPRTSSPPSPSPSPAAPRDPRAARPPSSLGQPSAPPTMGIVAEGPPTQLIGLLLAVAAGAFAVVWWMRKRGGPRAKASIEILASERLGPKHQLVVVRALGREHLLAMGPEGAKRIASVRREAAEGPRSSLQTASRAEEEVRLPSIFPWSKAPPAEIEAPQPTFDAQVSRGLRSTMRPVAPMAASDRISSLVRLRAKD